MSTDIRNTPLIIDSFLFYNEIKMLLFRLEELYKYVDYFVIVESEFTFIGDKKKCYFKENKHIFEKYLDKIVHLTFSELPDNNPWVNEENQRNFIKNAILTLPVKETDVVLISDVDEIPDVKILQELKGTGVSDVLSLEQDFYYYNLNCISNSKWYHAKVTNVKKISELPIHTIRHLSTPVISKSGWHLSYFGDENFISNKIKNFSHQEFNTSEFTSEEHIRYCIENNLDLFKRESENITYSYVGISENNFLPINYRMLHNKSLDVICLTNTLDKKYFELTQRTIDSIINSEKDVSFNIILIDSNPYSTFNYTNINHYIKLHGVFNYNKCLNIASNYLINNWVLITNNDVRYEKNWFSEILKVHKIDNTIESFSPKEMIYYSTIYGDHFGGVNNKEVDYWVNYNVSEGLLGWSLIMIKRVWDEVYPWDEEFDFYYQDNDYAKIIESKGIKHALVRDSLTLHIGNLSFFKNETNEVRDRKMEEGYKKYLKKWKN
jgi:beta-1,4-mannosyl-glycoprotein beta-1,4-N-acetylglucosaminyltransferase